VDRPAPAASPPAQATEDLRRTLLDVARDLFDRQGFQATTTAEISRKAGVSERVLFNNFGSKGALFNAAVIAPFVHLLTAYVDEWVQDTGEATPEERLDRLVNGLFELARQHRTALLTHAHLTGPRTPVGRRSGVWAWPAMT
jgi:AcrR family transcriptional regulator